MTLSMIPISSAIVAAGLAASPTVAQAQAQSVPVEVATVRSADMPRILQGLGTVQAYNTVTIHAQVDGVLQQIRFTEGQAVKAGDVLAQIDPRTYQAALGQAQAKLAQDQAQLRNAQLDLQRYADLAQSNFASRQQLATQQAAVAGLEAQLQGDQAAVTNAQTLLGYTTLTSPIDGITGIRLLDQGNLARAADATGIVVITQVRPISVVFTLPAEDLAEIRHAMAAGPLAMTVLERQGTKPLGTGTLLLVNNQIDPATGQLRLKATLPNENGALWPGQFATVQLLLQVEKGVPTLPSTAIQRGPDGYWVYVVGPDRTVAVQPVQVRRFGGGTAVLEGGPQPGTMVVSGGQYRLTPGAHIATATPKPPAAPGGEAAR